MLDILFCVRLSIMVLKTLSIMKALMRMIVLQTWMNFLTRIMSQPQILGTTPANGAQLEVADEVNDEWVFKQGKIRVE